MKQCLTGQELPGFVIRGCPRTKKTSNRVITIPQKGAHRCRACGHMAGFPKVLPSEAYERWEKSALEQSLEVMAALRARGVELPIREPVSVEALVYTVPTAAGAMRADVGDVAGYYQAIGDMLQAAGILADDRQIEDWDGSRRLVDAAEPRVEIYITIVGPAAPVQESLIGDKP